MATITTDSSKQPQPRFDYAGQRIGENDPYNGRPEHMADQSKLIMLRERARHAREVLATKRAKAAAKRSKLFA